jgi:hypothetical protein
LTPRRYTRSGFANSHWINTMYRCALAAIAAVFLSLAAPAAAQPFHRTFPQDALRGSFTIVAPPEIVLNGQPARLAPGSRIRTQQNMIRMSGELIGAKLLVHYTVDTHGLVKDVWILTPAEAARRPWPATPAEAQAWLFDWQTQTWSKP